MCSLAPFCVVLVPSSPHKVAQSQKSRPDISSSILQPTAATRNPSCSGLHPAELVRRTNFIKLHTGTSAAGTEFDEARSRDRLPVYMQVLAKWLFLANLMTFLWGGVR